MKSHKNSVLTKILKCIRPHTGLVFLSLITALISVFFTLLIPILIGNAVDTMESSGAVDFDRLKITILYILLSTLIIIISQWFMNHVNNLITYRVVKAMRISVFCKFQNLPLSYLDSHSFGDLLSRAITDIEQFSDGLLMGFTQLFTGILTIVGTIIFMARINPLITVVVVALTPSSFLLARFISSKTYSYFGLQSKTRGTLTGLTNEMLENIKLVQAFSQEEYVQKQFDELNSQLQDCGLKATFYSSLTNPCTRFMNSVIYAGVTLAGCIACISGGLTTLTVGALTSFLSYTSQYARPFNEITGVITEFQNALASADRVFKLLEEPEIPDLKDPVHLPVPVHGTVSLENVAFSYHPEKPLISRLNFHVNPGEHIAIVGPTGCGKTTLINLLMRFYDVNSGIISVENIDTAHVTRHELRSQYGMVLQDTWLKCGTIRENIKYGNPDATDEEMFAAAEAAYADSFISRLPQGYDTIIEENGGSLSQGEKQLLCIARVMLTQPPMLILDEATSSIDTRTEVKVQQAFENMMKGRTCFIVAHRLSTIRTADLILVMKDGHIIEQGNHDALMKKGGFYCQLHNSQFSE